MATEYGKRLKQARLHAGLNQVQLGKVTGISQSTISTAERLGNGSTDTAAYAKACGVSAHWLETGQGEMLPATAAANLSAPSGFLTANASASTHALARMDKAQPAINIEAAIDAIANALMRLDPLARAGPQAYLASLCAAPERADLRKMICTALEPPATHKDQPETGARRAA